MRTLIQNHDLKRLLAGAAIAVVAGLAIGGAIQPALDENGIHAPQQLMSGGGARTHATAPEPSVGAYQGKVPDYVIGTDWLQPPMSDEQVLAYEERAEQQEAHDATAHAAPADTAVPARWHDRPREAPLYPSERGNTHYGADLPAPPEPPSDEAAEPAAA